MFWCLGGVMQKKSSSKANSKEPSFRLSFELETRDRPSLGAWLVVACIALAGSPYLMDLLNWLAGRVG